MTDEVFKRVREIAILVFALASTITAIYLIGEWLIGS